MKIFEKHYLQHLINIERNHPTNYILICPRVKLQVIHKNFDIRPNFPAFTLISKEKLTKKKRKCNFLRSQLTKTKKNQQEKG